MRHQAELPNRSDQVHDVELSLETDCALLEEEVSTVEGGERRSEGPHALASKNEVKNLSVAVVQASPLKDEVHKLVEEAIVELCLVIEVLEHFLRCDPLTLLLKLSGNLIKLPQECAFKESLLKEIDYH